MVCAPPGAHKEKPPLDFPTGVRVWSLAVTYSCMAKDHTTIGAGRFHFRVRCGIGWFPLAIRGGPTRERRQASAHLHIEIRGRYLPIGSRYSVRAVCANRNRFNDGTTIVEGLPWHRDECIDTMKQSTDHFRPSGIDSVFDYSCCGATASSHRTGRCRCPRPCERAGRGICRSSSQ